MNWTTEKPGVEGWYWYRDTEMDPRAVQVWQSRVHSSIFKASGLGEVRSCNGEWFGPLEVPP